MVLQTIQAYLLYSDNIKYILKLLILFSLKVKSILLFNHMDNIDLNSILNRTKIEDTFRKKMIEFENNKKDLTMKRGFFFYGNPGVGKTEFVKRILTSMNYDVIMYDSGDIRNKSIIESITKYNMNDKNVLSMFTKTPKKIVIIMDEIDGMNNGDKGGLASLIKLVREKKTKKQKQEDYSLNPIVCIGNYHFDKKLTELKKVCNSYELQEPKPHQVSSIITTLMPKIDNDVIDLMIKYIASDLRKINTCYYIYNNNKDLMETREIFSNIFQTKVNNEFSKDLTKKLINNYVDLDKHNIIVNETDRTSISLLFHENIIDIIPKDREGNKYYRELLDSYCYSDYLDRITFQKQIWVFNELTSILKTIKGNNEYYKLPSKKQTKLNDNVRFTKILTKYSTEYNNQLFISNLCSKMQLDRSDVISFFISKKDMYEENPVELYSILNDYDISKLDIDRIYRFFKYI